MYYILYILLLVFSYCSGMEQPSSAGLKKGPLKPLAMTTSGDIIVNLYLSGSYGDLNDQQLVLEISAAAAASIKTQFYNDRAIISVKRAARKTANRAYIIKGINREDITKVIQMPVDVTSLKATIVETACSVIYKWQVPFAIKQPSIEPVLSDKETIKIDEDIYQQGNDLVVELAIPGVTEVTVDLQKQPGWQLLFIRAKRKQILSPSASGYALKTYYVRTFATEELTKMIRLMKPVKEGEMKITKNDQCIVTIKMPLAT